MNSAGTAVQEYEEGQEHAQSGKDKLYSEVDGQGKQGKVRKTAAAYLFLLYLFLFSTSLNIRHAVRSKCR